MFSFGKKKNRPLYVVNFMSPGGARGVLLFGPLIFLEAVTRTPLSKLFNMHSGCSAGGSIAGILSIPESKGSNKTRYSALDGEEGYKKILQYALPKRYGRTAWRVGGGILREIHEGRKKLTSTICYGLDKYLTLAANFTDRKVHKLLDDPSQARLRRIDFFSRLNEKKIKWFDDMVEDLIEWMVNKARYDINILYRAVDAAFRYKDTNEPVNLNDTATSYVVTTWNLTRNTVGSFVNVKTEKGESVYVSDPDTNLSDITAASCAAPTYFDMHEISYADGKEHYTDPGLADTAISPIFTLQRVFGDERGYKIIILGTGTDDKKFEKKMMQSIKYGIVDIPQMFSAARDEGAMKQSLGEENVVKIDLPISLETFSKLYGGDEKLMRAASILGFDLTERDKMSPWEKLPSGDKFETSSRIIEQLSEAKWDMVWHNMDQMVDLSKWLLNNAVQQGRITPEFAKQAISDINWMYPPEGHSSSEYPEPKTPFPNLRQAQSSIVIEPKPSQEKRGKLSGLFRRKTDLELVIRDRVANDNDSASSTEANHLSRRRDDQSTSLRK